MTTPRMAELLSGIMTERGVRTDPVIYYYSENPHRVKRFFGDFLQNRDVRRRSLSFSILLTIQLKMRIMKPATREKEYCVC